MDEPPTEPRSTAASELQESDIEPGGPQTTGPLNGLRAQLARVPFANVGPAWLPEEVSDDATIMLSDIYPTVWFGARPADVQQSDTVLAWIDHRRRRRGRAAAEVRPGWS